MQGLRLRAWLAMIGAVLLLEVPALAQDQNKAQAPTKPTTTETAKQPAEKSIAPPAVAPQPQTPVKAQPPAKPVAPPVPRHIDTPKQEADSLLGKEVYGADGAQMGLVTNILVDRAGHPIALVIDFGGFLGVGSRKVAVDWKLMHFHPGDSKKPVTLSLSKEQLKAAPEYKPDKAAAPVVQAPRPTPAKPAATAKPAAPPSEHKNREDAKPAPPTAPDQPSAK